MMNHLRTRNASTGRSGGIGLIAATLVCICLAGTARAQAPPPSSLDDVSIFASATGVDRGPVFMDSATDTSFDLYVDVGGDTSNPRDACAECDACGGGCDACNFCVGSVSDPLFGAPCNSSPNGGDGHELCGLDMEIVLSGDVRITSFSVDSTLCGSTAQFAWFPVAFDFNSTNLRLNVLCGVVPLPPGIHRLGTLGVNLGALEEDAIASVSVSSTVAIGANRQARNIALNLLAAPEPSFALALASGVCTLATMAAVRIRRRSGRD